MTRVCRGGQETVKVRGQAKSRTAEQQLTRVVPAVTPGPGKRAVEGGVQVVENPRRNEHVVEVEVGQEDLGGEADS